MSILDWIILILFVLHIWSGFKEGFIYKIGSLAGLILGIYLAGMFYDVIAETYLKDIPLGSLAAFAIVQMAVSMVIGIVFKVISKVFNLVAIIPGIKLINKSGGAVVAILEYLVIAGVLVYVGSKVSTYSTSIQDVLETSRFVPTLLKIGELFAGLLPDSLTSLTGILL